MSSFGQLTVNTNTYNPVGDGKYMISTWAFGQPTNYFKVVGGKTGKGSINTNAAVTRCIEIDVTEDGKTFRRPAIVTLQIQMPRGSTAAHIDDLTSDISEFLNISNINDLMAGRQ